MYMYQPDAPHTFENALFIKALFPTMACLIRSSMSRLDPLSESLHVRQTSLTTET